MKVTIRNTLADLFSFVRHIRKRETIFREAPATPVAPGKINTFSSRVHPPVQEFTVTERIIETPTTVTFRLRSSAPGAQPAIFRAGQYVSLQEEVNGVTVSRPFSIACSPDESRNSGAYDLTIRQKDDGFLAPHILSTWDVGTTARTSDPQGFFHYEPLRDSGTLVCLAGGSGVTPFRSLVPDLLSHQPDVRIILLYGITTPGEIIYRDFWTQTASAHAERFTFVPVCSEPPDDWRGERGFLTEDLIRRMLSNGSVAPALASFFICGPAAMHTFVERELAPLKLPRRLVRQENYGGARPDRGPASPDKTEDQSYTITVHQEGAPDPVQVPALASETVLTALERAGLNPPALCRSGECGWCRSRLIEGEVVRAAGHDGTRAADHTFGYFHPCSSWPASDLTMRVPRNPKE